MPLKKILLFSFLFLLTKTFFAQNRFTPYDDLPQINKSIKPSFNENFPRWAKMMYESDVNYFEVVSIFNQDNSQYKKKCPILRYFKNWRRAVGAFVEQDGTITLPDQKLYDNHLLKTQLQSKTRIKTRTDHWTFVGPKQTFWLNESNFSQPTDPCSWQANVYTFDVAESNSNILYCGTETGFVNKSTDKGMTWELLGQGFPFGGAISSIAIHPTNPDVVFASAKQYIYKSEDGGTTWNTALTASGNDITQIRINPTTPTKMIASGSSGLFLSENGGQNWQKVFNGNCWDVVYKADDANKLFALTLSNGRYRMLESIDGGENFTTISNFPNNIVESSGGLITVTKASPNELFYVLLSENNTPILGKGILSGSNWTWQTITNGNTNQLDLNNGQGFFDLVLAVSPDNANHIYVGTTSLFKSTDGRNFQAIGGYKGNFPIHPDIQDIKILDNNEVWVSTDGGMNYSSDAFVNATNYASRNNGLVGSAMWGFDQGWNEDLIVGGRYHNGNTAIAEFYGNKALRMGGAESPTGWVLQGKSRHVTFDDLGNGWVLPPTADAPAAGRFFFSKYPNMDEYGGRRSNLIHHPNYYETLYLGQGDGFWESTDMGANFELRYQFPDRVRYVQIAGSNPDVFYADIVGRGLYKTENGGTSWQAKPSLTNSNNGGDSWKGKTFFVISPYDENTIYACLQNGTWSKDIGQVFKSNDGGDSWQNWSAGLNVLTKNMIIQPASDNRDIVYLFSNSGNGQAAKVYYRYSDMNQWEIFGTDFPAGMEINIGLPFYRDSKVRVSGNAGIWEADFVENNYEPILNPWVSRKIVNCMTDTIGFEDHSILDHADAKWTWSFDPEPLYVSDSGVRNPKVVLGNPSSYSVTMTIEKNGNQYSKTIENMVTATTCPSLDDCDNPTRIPKDQWAVLSFDSEELNFPGYASMVIDDDYSTIWHTRWSTGNDPYPHEIVLDLDTNYTIQSFIYYPRTDGVNGRIKDYEIYFSREAATWEQARARGQWQNSAAPKTVQFENDFPDAQYVKLIARSEVNGGPWASCAEIDLIGCYTTAGVTSTTQVETKNPLAFPIPFTDQLTITIGKEGIYSCLIYSSNGQLITTQKIESFDGRVQLALNDLPKGAYFIHLQNQNGISYVVKTMKNE